MCAIVRFNIYILGLVGTGVKSHKLITWSELARFIKSKFAYVVRYSALAIFWLETKKGVWACKQIEFGPGPDFAWLSAITKLNFMRGGLSLVTELTKRLCRNFCRIKSLLTYKFRLFRIFIFSTLRSRPYVFCANGKEREGVSPCLGTKNRFCFQGREKVLESCSYFWKNSE